MTGIRFQTRNDTSAAIRADSREIDFLVSSATTDRAGDRVDQSGWKLDNYLKNPVVLLNHDRHGLPVARAKELRLTNQGLAATFTFATAADNPIADNVFRLYQGGFMNAVSVGFRPLKYAFNDEGGVDFLEHELLEVSTVTVPCNPEALASALAKGLDLGPLAKWAATSARPEARAIADLLAATPKGHSAVAAANQHRHLSLTARRIGR